MKPLNSFIMLKKRPKAESSVGIILPGEQEEIRATGFDVIKIGDDVTNIKVGDVVFPGYPEEAAKINGYVFCKAVHIIAKE